MRHARRLLVLLALLQVTCLAAAGALEGEWVSYRDAYRAMVVFEKYGGAKNLILNELQVLPRQAGAAEPQLSLDGKATHLKLALDPTGRTVFPLLKSAYDENAVLALDHEAFALRPRVSIAVRPDGVYDTAELRAACAQALGYVRYVDASARARQCTGVRFVFDRKAAGTLARLHQADGATIELPAAEGAAFGSDPGNPFPTVVYRFNGAGHAQVLTSSAPLAIAPLFE
jgi:hypothetical protein